MTSITNAAAYTNALAQLQKSFKTADTNGNGTISATEFEAVAKASAGLSGKDGLSTTTIFKRLDADGSGAITQAELSQGINLAAQVQAVLLQGQEIGTNGAYSQLLTNTGKPAGNSLTTTLLGGGNATTSLTSLLTGANANTAASAGLFGGLSDSTSALIQQLIARYTEMESS